MLFLLLSSLLLLYAVYQYLSGDKLRSVIVFLFFATEGFQIVPAPGNELNFLNFGALYLVFIAFYKLFSRKRSRSSCLNTWVGRLLAVIGVCILFSISYYDFTLIDALRVFRRDYIYFLSVYVFADLRREELLRILRILFYITTFQCLLYILQVPYGKPILVYYKDVELGESIEVSTGLSRFYNAPYFLAFFFYYALWFQTERAWLKWGYVSIYLLAILATQGRAFILISILTGILFYSFISVKKIKVLIILLLICLITYPFYSLMADRFGEGDTAQDIESVFSGRKISADSGTFAFRMAILSERFEYIRQAPFLVKCFGLGVADDRSVHVRKYYHFSIGNLGERNIMQLWTPDIALVNILVNLGIVGTVAVFLFLIKTTLFFYRNRSNVFCLMAFLLMSTKFFEMFFGSTSLTAATFLMPFLAFYTLPQHATE